MDEEQISMLRAALHHWIDHATVEQLEQMNHVVAVDARRFVPVALLPPRQSKSQSTPQPPRTSPVDRWNAENMSAGGDMPSGSYSAGCSL